MKFQRRVELENFLAVHNRKLNAMTLEDQADALHDVIEKSCRILAIDNVFALIVSPRTLKVEKSWESSGDKRKKIPAGFGLDIFSWALPQLLSANGAVAFASETIPGDAAAEQMLFRRRGWTTLIALPLNQDKGLWGLTGFAFSGISLTDSAWDADELQAVKIIGDMIGSRLRQIQMQDELVRVRKRWDLLAMGTQDIFWDWDMLGNKVAYSCNAPATWSSWVDELQDKDGKAFLHRVHPDDLPALETMLLQHWRQKTTLYQATFRLLHGDGTYHPVLSRGIISYNDDGKPLRMVGATTDNKTLATTQMEIRRQTDILNQTNECVLVTDLEGVLNYWNKSAEKLMGYSSTEVLGRKADFLSPAKENLRIRFEDIFQKVRVRGSFDLDVLIRKKSGEVFLGHLFATLLKNENGEPYAIVAYLMDQASRNSNKHEVRKMMNRQKKNDVIRILLSKNGLSQKEVQKLIQLAEIEIGKPAVCMVIFVESMHGKKQLRMRQETVNFRDLLNRILELCEPEVSIAWADHDMVGLIQNREPSAKPKVQSRAAQGYVSALVQRMETGIPGLKVIAGVSRAFTQWQDLPRAYQEALQAARIGGRVNGPGHYCYDEIGVYRILQQLIGQASTQEFITETIGALLEHDQRRKPWMLQTLEILLDSDCSKAAAGILDIHPKTLAFRRKRIEELLGIPLDHPQERMKLSIAVALQKLID